VDEPPFSRYLSTGRDRCTTAARCFVGKEQRRSRFGDCLDLDLPCYLEQDGVLHLIALLAAVIVLAVATAAIWQMVVGAKWIIDLW
jgi:hypothetical protein